MRPNTMKKALHEGHTVICMQPHFSSPELVEFLGYLGYDGIFIDAEHGVVGVERAQEMVRAADVANVATVIRVPANDPAVILGYLESGVGGVLVPHVNSAADAEVAVRAVKFAPLGTRGAHPATRAANYGLTQSSLEYFRQANHETMVGVMIEEIQALEGLDEILTVPGLDLCVIGPGDLSMSMGYPGQPDHPAVREQIGLALQRILASGVAAGTTASDGRAVRFIFEQGFRFAIVNAAKLLAAHARQLLDQARGEDRAS